MKINFNFTSEAKYADPEDLQMIEMAIARKNNFGLMDGNSVVHFSPQKLASIWTVSGVEQARFIYKTEHEFIKAIQLAFLAHKRFVFAGKKNK